MEAFPPSEGSSPSVSCLRGSPGQLGELSSARQALEGHAVAPGNDRTLQALRDPLRRPPAPRDPLQVDLQHFQPEVPFSLKQDRLLNLRAGPSGMIADHLRPLLESVQDSELLWRLCQGLARAEVPLEVPRVVKMGRITALQKPTGGVRGIVVGDILRRLVARTISQQITPAVEVATAPFQFALSTRAGTECVSHVLQARTDLDPMGTVLSFDGVGAFDLVSRTSMLRGFQGVEGGGSVLPFVRQFKGGTSSFLRDDACGNTHDIFQGEGGEQGDPLMPALYSLGQRTGSCGPPSSPNGAPLRLSGRLVRRMSTGSSGGRPPHSRRRTVVLCKDSDSAREDTGVEPRRSRADGDRDITQVRRSGVERGPYTPGGGAGNENSRHPVGPSQLCAVVPPCKNRRPHTCSRHS